jgi:hypothetical protein
MRWVGHVVCMGKINIKKFWLKSLKGRDHPEYIGIDGRII